MSEKETAGFTSGEAPEPTGDVYEDPRLRTWERCAAGLISVAGFVFGTEAVFTRDVEAGPVALIAVGFLAGLIAVSGRLPSRIKFGDSEAAWRGERRAGEAIARIIEQTPTDVRESQVVELEAIAETDPVVAAPALRAIAFEREAVNVLRRLCASLSTRYGVSIHLKTGVPVSINGALDLSFDALITRRGIEKQILVEAVASNSRNRISGAASRLLMGASAIGSDALLVVPSITAEALAFTQSLMLPTLRLRADAVRSEMLIAELLDLDLAVFDPQ